MATQKKRSVGKKAKSTKAVVSVSRTRRKPSARKSSMSPMKEVKVMGQNVVSSIKAALPSPLKGQLTSSRRKKAVGATRSRKRTTTAVGGRRKSAATVTGSRVGVRAGRVVRGVRAAGRSASRSARAA